MSVMAIIMIALEATKATLAAATVAYGVYTGKIKDWTA